MSRTIDVVFDGEVFRPEHPINLRRNQHYSIVIEDQTDTHNPPLPNVEAIDTIDIAWKIYDQRLKSILEPSFNGQVVAVDPLSGDFEVARNSPSARRALQQRHPEHQFVVIDIGVLSVDNPLAVRNTGSIGKRK